MQEEWRPTHHPNYDVSNLGRVRSRARGKNHIMTAVTIPSTGYLKVAFGRKKQHLVHRLVAAAFIGPCPENQEVRHKDDNPGNPRRDNLEYGTRSQNIMDSVQRGRWVQRGQKGEACPTAKLTSPQVSEIKVLLSEGILTHQEIATLFGMSKSLISAINQGRAWAHV